MAKKPKADGELDELRDLISENGNGDEAPKKTNRRNMLRMAGAALVGAAGAAAVRVVPASAATGDYMIVGCTNSGTGTTVLQSGAASGGTFNAQSNASTGTGVQGGATTGVHGLGAAQGGASTASEVGVLGDSKSCSGSGVVGSSNGGVGVQGNATTGAAGYFVATTGYDTQLGALNGDSGIIGSGRLSTIGRPDVGGVAPNWNPKFFTHTSLGILNFQHEFVRGADGSIWASRSVKIGSGIASRGRWKRVNTVRTDATDGSGNFFKPKRVIDTRSGAIKAPGTLTVVTIAGVGSGTSAIPFDAVAVMGNLTAAGYTGGGFLTIMPAGIVVGTGVGQYNPSSDPSSVNFIVGQYAIANSFVCGLHNGQLQVYVGGPPLPGHSSHFIIDITAYMQ